MSKQLMIFIVILFIFFCATVPLCYIGINNYRIGGDEISHLRKSAYSGHPKDSACINYNKKFYQYLFPKPLKLIDGFLASSASGDSAAQKKIDSIIKNTRPITFNARSINYTLNSLDAAYIKKTETNCLSHLIKPKSKNLWRELFLEGFSYTASIVRDSFIVIDSSGMPNVGLYIKGETPELYHFYDERKDTLAIQISQKLESLKGISAMIPKDWLNSDSIYQKYLDALRKKAPALRDSLIKAANLYKLQKQYANHTIVFFHGYEVRLHSYTKRDSKSSKVQYYQQIFIAPPPDQLKKGT